MEPVIQTDWQANRKNRRAFYKRMGVWLPPKYFPHVKADGYAKCKCMNCKDKRTIKNATKPKDKQL